MHESHARKFAVILEFDPDDDVWVTYVPSLGHLSTYGKTRDEALQQTREAIAGYLEVAAKEKLKMCTQGTLTTGTTLFLGVRDTLAEQF